MMPVLRSRDEIAIDIRRQLSQINDLTENLYADFDPVRTNNEMQRLRSLVGQLDHMTLIYMRARH